MSQIFGRQLTMVGAVAVTALCAAAARVDAATCSAAQGQLYIDQGRYDKAVREFSCLIDAQPTEVEGYRGRIEAEVLLNQFSYAVRDYQRVTALVMPVHPDAQATILAGYKDRLAAAPDDIPSLTGASFAHWWFFDYASAIHVLNHLLELQPSGLYVHLFEGSARLLKGSTTTVGIAEIETAISLAPDNPHVRFIVADAYTYGLPDPQRAFQEASLALDGGLDTPRIRAILAVCYAAFGDLAAAAGQIALHIQMVTTELVPTAPLAAGTSLTLGLVPGRTFEIPIPAVAGEVLDLSTSSPTHEIYDSIMVLLAPDGTPVIGSDDAIKYFAAIDWNVPATGTYRLRVTSFESVNTGQLAVTRK